MYIKPVVAVFIDNLLKILFLNCIQYWVKILDPTQRIHFGDVLPSQPLGLVVNKLNLMQQNKNTNKMAFVKTYGSFLLPYMD